MLLPKGLTAVVLSGRRMLGLRYHIFQVNVDGTGLVHQAPAFGADDLAVDVPVAPWEAALGARVGVPLLEGEATLSVPAGTSSCT